MMMQAIHTLKQGYAPLYRAGMRCPSCDNGGWLLGRRDAECSSCGTALPIAPAEGVRAEPNYPGWSARA